LTDHVEAVQTDFGDGDFLRDNTFSTFPGVGKYPRPLAHACGRPGNSKFHSYKTKSALN